MPQPYEQLRKDLENYKPYNVEEAGCVASFLYFVNSFKDNIYTRDNILGHVCSSAWVVNKSRTKTLMAYHNIYQSFAWLGGHADGDTDLLHVARKEVEEESGLSNFKALNNGIFFDVASGTVRPHMKRGKHIPEHIHFDLCYAFEADENDPLRISEGENSAVQWIDNDKLLDMINEEHMKPIYKRMMEKVKNLK